MKVIKTTATPWRDVVLVCKKCSRKLDGGFGVDGAEKLRASLKGALRARGHRRDVRVIEIGCVGLCPKKAISVVRASRPENIHAVPEGTGMDDILSSLGF